VSKFFKTPLEAEAAFYRSIERADIDALDAVWSTQDNIVCVHPGASRIEGRKAVMDSFIELFIEAPVLNFSIVDTLYTGNDELAVHLVREEIELDGQVISIMVSTNIYHLEAGGWRMLLHHISKSISALAPWASMISMTISMIWTSLDVLRYCIDLLLQSRTESWGRDIDYLVS